MVFFEPNSNHPGYIIKQQQNTDDMRVRTYSKCEDKMQVAGLVERSQKSFAEVMAEQLEEQTNTLINGDVVSKQQGTISVISASGGHTGIKEKDALPVSDLFAEKDFILCNGIKAVMKRHRAYSQMSDSKFADKAVANHQTVSADITSDHSVIIPNKIFGEAEATSRIAVSTQAPILTYQAVIRAVI